MKIIKTINFLSVALIVTIIFLIIYATVQQSYRTSANDPQIEIATEVNISLAKGVGIERYFIDTINLEKSLLPFITIYDTSFHIIKSSGRLNGKFLKIPAGVFNNIKKEEIKSITTQPTKDLRFAMAIIRTNNDQYIAVGRSLLEVEKREQSLIRMVVMGWITGMSILLLTFFLNARRSDS